MYQGSNGLIHSGETTNIRLPFEFLNRHFQVKVHFSINGLFFGAGFEISPTILIPATINFSNIVFFQLNSNLSHLHENITRRERLMSALYIRLKESKFFNTMKKKLGQK